MVRRHCQMLASISAAVCLKRKGNGGEWTSWMPPAYFRNRREEWPRRCTHSGEQDFLTERLTINAEYYSALFEGPVKAAIRNKRKRAQISVSFLQDNARPHVAARTMDTIQKLKRNVLPHPPYSPDVQEWLHWQPKDFFRSGIRKLPERWCKCITNQGDYVEK